MLLSDFDKKYNLQPVPTQEELDSQNIPSVYKNVAPKADNIFLSTAKNIGKGIVKDIITQPIRATQALSALGSEVIGGKVGDKMAEYAFSDLQTPVGTIPKIEQGMTGVGQGVGEGLKTLSYAPLAGMGTSAIAKGITSGAVGGATYGAGEALSNKDTQNVGSVLQNTVMGGTVGGILGGAVSGVTKGISSYLAKRAEKQGTIKILSDKTLAQKESEALNSHIADLLSPDKVDDFAKTRFGFDDPTFLRDKTGKLDEAVFGELKDEVSKEVSQNIPFAGAKDTFDNAVKGKPLTEDTLKQAYIDTVNKFRIVDPKTALYKVEKGRLISDKNAKDLIKSGIPVADIQVAKSGNTQERKLFSQMLDTAEERVNNPTFNDRVLKPVADDLLNTYDKYVVQTGKKIGKTLGDMRASFEGKKVSVEPVMSAYDNMLSELGIAKNPKTGEILFGNSPLRNSEKMMQLVTKVDDEISRLNAGKTAKNADVVADALRQITQDEPAVQGTYAQRLIGQIKTAIDDTIDSSVSGYKQVKKEFAMNKQIQDELESMFGTKFDVNDANRGAELLRRLESNAGARIDNIVSAIQDEAERHGYTGVNFKGLVRLGSTLEKVTGNVPRNSLEGIGERVMGGAMQGVEMAKDLATGNIAGLAKKGVELTAKGSKQLEPLEYIAKLRELNNTVNDFTVPKSTASKVYDTLTGKDIPNRQGGFIKNPLANTGDNLIQEAKKYKSAEEFIKAQGTPIYHGSNEKIKIFSPKKGAQGVIWFTDNPKAIIGGESGAQGTKFINERITTGRKFAGWDEYKKLGLGQIESMGFDGIKLPTTMQDGTKYNDYILFNNKSIKTKSQLEDIWKQANKK